MDIVAETINTYNSFAQDYRQRYDEDKDNNQMQIFLDKFLNFLGNKKEVLDIGNGAGFDAKYLSDKGTSVTSIDIADELLKIAKEIAPSVNYLRMDMRNMTFKDNSFDGVWCAASLLHLPKSEATGVLDKIHAILKPDGIFFLGLKQGTCENFVTNKGKGNLDGVRRYFAYYTKEEIEKILKDIGFELFEYSTNTNRGNIWMNLFSRKN